MTIEVEGKVYQNKEQALCELAFCHYPITVTVDGESLIFEWFSDLENYFKSH